MKIIEFIGLPASGKSFVRKKIKLNLNKSNSKNFSYVEFLFIKDNLNKFFFIRTINSLKKFYFLNSLNENFFKSSLKSLIINLTIRLILLSLKKHKYLLFYKSYKKLLSFSSHSPHRKKRMEIYFLFKLLSFNICSQKLNKKNCFILDDEGFLQSLIFKYDNFKNKKKEIFREIDKFLYLSPLPNKIILVENKIANVIKRSKLRKIGYRYYSDDKKNKLSDWKEIEKYIINMIKKKKISNIKFQNKKNYNIKIDKLINFIKKSVEK